jgi:hypothetical protein
MAAAEKIIITFKKEDGAILKNYIVFILKTLYAIYSVVTHDHRISSWN